MSRTGKNVLLVEDELALLMIAEDALVEAGFRVETAQTAPDALRLIEDGFQPDVLCTDISMPGGMSGVQLAHKVTKLLPSTKVLLVTGREGQVMAGNQRDGFQVLGKPYQNRTLARTVERILDIEL